METLSILIIDDEEGIRQEIGYYLEQNDFRIYSAESRAAAMEIFERNPIDIAILDINLGADNGLDILREIRQRWGDTQVIMITAFGSEETILEALRAGAFDFFHKPFRLIDLETTIRRTSRFIELEKRCARIEKDNDILQTQLRRTYGHPIIGDGQHIQEVKALIGKVASTPSTSVLVTGESGTGKELIAHSIHLLSNRKNQLFYPINCSSIPEHLFESELFGHVRGAFTGADHDKIGWIQAASHGTLVLDEIADMPLTMQTKLLRVLETGTVTPVGARKEIPVDVRFIALTNRNLQAMVQEGSFRLDLYYRLNRFQIHLKPLRERADDLPQLIEYYLDYFLKKLRKPICKIDTYARQSLIEYTYPGNVRELRNILERAVILCDGVISRKHLTLSGEFPQEPRSTSTLNDNLDLEQLEKNAICEALKRTGNNKSQAARLLNITWFALDRRMKKYGL